MSRSKVGGGLNTEYDIFEVIPDGGTVWRAGPFELDAARIALQKFGKTSSNQFFAMDVISKQIVARVPPLIPPPKQ